MNKKTPFFISLVIILFIIFTCTLVYLNKSNIMTQADLTLGTFSNSPYPSIHIYSDEWNKLKKRQHNEPSSKTGKFDYYPATEEEYYYLKNKYGDYGRYFTDDTYSGDILYNEYLDSKPSHSALYTNDFYALFERTDHHSTERYLIISLASHNKSLTIYPKLTFSDEGIQVEVQKETEGLMTDSFEVDGKTVLVIQLWADKEIVSVLFEGKTIPKRGAQ